MPLPNNIPPQVRTDLEKLLASGAPRPVEVIGSQSALDAGVAPVVREMTLADVDDDCAICLRNRALIESGTPPIVLVYEDAAA